MPELIKRPSGFGRVMSGLNESEAKRKVTEQLSERKEKALRIKEKFEGTPGLALDSKKLDEMFNSNPKKAENLMLFLDATEQDALSQPMLLENVNRYKAIQESKALREDVQTSGFLGVTPMDIVKVARIAYPNSIAPDLFDFWGMSSMKDSIYKLETLYGSTARGATANGVVYENYNEGRYPSEIEKETITAAVQTIFTGTTDQFPLRPFTVQLYLNGDQIATDDGNGKIVGTSVLNSSATNTINYTTGDYTITFASNRAVSDEIYFYYNYNSELSSLFSNVGSVLLNLVVYDYRAQPYPLAIEWTRFTEELMASKLGMSAKESLIAGAADIFRKSIDEWCVTKATKAANWTSAITFDTDYAAAGSDSSYEHAQSVLNAIMSAEMLTYKDLGRHADKYNIVCDYQTATYLTKHRLFNAFNAPSRIGIYKWGDLAGHDVYVAPPSIVNYDTTNKIGTAYVFGKGNDNMNVDSVVSVGTWKAGVTTNPVELKNFNSQMGMAFFGDIRVNNKKFSTRVSLTNLTPNS